MDRSKARQAKRAQALTPRRGRKPGVKMGPTPLRKSGMRFEVAVFGMLVRTRLRNSPIHAAEFAASVFNSSVKVSCIEGGLCFDYTGGRGVVQTIKVAVDGVVVVKHKHDRKKRDDARRNRRDKILREAPGLIAGATGGDLMWLEVSRQALDGLFNAVVLGDEIAFRSAWTILETKLGWPPSAAKLFLI